MNITKLVSTKPARWYNLQGEAIYQVPYKDPKRKGEMKDVTLREAREMNLLPSVTTVLQIVAKPELEAWKIEQGIMAALTLPREQDEPTDAFAKRVVVDMERQAGEAAEFGSQIHAIIQAHLTGDLKTLQEAPKEVLPWLDEFIKWQENAGLTVYSTEEVVVNQYHGYAGRLDFHGKLDLGGIGECVIDFKTQKVKAKPVFYDEWGMQLAAYRGCFPWENGQRSIACVSLIMDSAAPKPPALKVWENDEECLAAFLNAHRLWCFMKGYDPGQNNSEDA